MNAWQVDEEAHSVSRLLREVINLDMYTTVSPTRTAQVPSWILCTAPGSDSQGLMFVPCFLAQSSVHRHARGRTPIVCWTPGVICAARDMWLLYRTLVRGLSIITALQCDSRNRKSPSSPSTASIYHQIPHLIHSRVLLGLAQRHCSSARQLLSDVTAPTTMSRTSTTVSGG